VAYVFDRGDAKRAVAAAERAVKSSRDHRFFRSGTHERRTVKLRKSAEHTSEWPQKPSFRTFVSYARLLLGEVDLKNGDCGEGVKNFRSETSCRLWLGAFDRAARIWYGEPFRGASAFDCMKRRGEEAAIFLDDVPRYHSMRRFCIKGTWRTRVRARTPRIFQAVWPSKQGAGDRDRGAGASRIELNFNPSSGVGGKSPDASSRSGR